MQRATGCSRRHGRWATSATIWRSACARDAPACWASSSPISPIPFWAEVARGAQDRAADAGASLLVFSSDWDHAREARHLQALRQARVDGVIINPVADSFDDLDRFGLPFVLIGSSAERFPDTSSVGSDITQAVRLGMDHLVSKGHRRPWLMLGPRWRIARARFLRAVHDHCVERDVDPASLPIEDGEYTVEGGHAAMQRILDAGPERPHLGVRCQRSDGARRHDGGARGRAAPARSRSPYLGFDGIPGGAFAWPGLTTIEKPARALGRRAVESLVRRNSGPRRSQPDLPPVPADRARLARRSVGRQRRPSAADRERVMRVRPSSPSDASRERSRITGIGERSRQSQCRSRAAWT